MTAPISDEALERLLFKAKDEAGYIKDGYGFDVGDVARDMFAAGYRAALQEPVEDRLLHPEELRRFLGIKTPALKRSLARLGIPVINVGGHVRVSERMLNDWIRESSRPLPWGKDHDDEAEDTQDET
jgi:hypothetical protein